MNAQAADNASTFTTANLDVSSRPRTLASVAWSPTSWSSGQGGAAQRTPNLSALVQEVVSRPGWASGHAIAFVIRGSGQRTAESYDGSSTKAPRLLVEYQ